MKKIFSVLLIITLVAMLAACSKKVPEEETVPNDSEIMGTWTESYWDSGYIFNEDGTGKDIFWDQEFTYTAIDGKLTITFTDGTYADKVFTYSISEGSLTLTKEGEDGGTFSYTKS